MITASLASIPSREKQLKKVVSSLLPQVDKLNVYLNNYKKVPSFLRSPKIAIAKSQEHGDIGDIGKFFWCETISGYHFTCDDDILYNPNYIRKAIQRMSRYNDKAVLSYHGSILKNPFLSYKNSREVYCFWEQLDRDTPVHIGGTGVSCYHTDTVKIKLKDFLIPNMADIWLALYCQKNEIPIITPSRPINWFRRLKTSSSIWEGHSKKKTYAKKVNKAIKSNKHWTFGKV